MARAEWRVKTNANQDHSPAGLLYGLWHAKAIQPP
jgi:hypothetical protein